MKKAEAEQAVRYLCDKWREARGLPLPPSKVDYIFSDFKSWVDDQGYGHYLNFRSTGGVVFTAEIWFDQEMRQTGRN